MHANMYVGGHGMRSGSNDRRREGATAPPPPRARGCEASPRLPRPVRARLPRPWWRARPGAAPRPRRTQSHRPAQRRATLPVGGDGPRVCTLSGGIQWRRRTFTPIVTMLVGQGSTKPPHPKKMYARTHTSTIPHASTHLRHRGCQPALQVPANCLRHLRLRQRSRQPLLRPAQLAIGQPGSLRPGAQLRPCLCLRPRGHICQPCLELRSKACLGVAPPELLLRSDSCLCCSQLLRCLRPQRRLCFGQPRNELRLKPCLGLLTPGLRLGPRGLCLGHRLGQALRRGRGSRKGPIPLGGQRLCLWVGWGQGVR
jgi:hypothetical protein